ncbi:MAG: serine hydrolase [Defluviitaleaceae bacterium]|nr:serine hydrolase [Defluviitaleaceae bacterium]
MDATKEKEEKDKKEEEVITEPIGTTQEENVTAEPVDQIKELKDEIAQLQETNEKLLSENQNLSQKIAIFEDLRDKKNTREEREKQKKEKFKFSVIAACVTLCFLVFLFLYRTEIATIFANINNTYHENPYTPNPVDPQEAEMYTNDTDDIDTDAERSIMPIEEMVVEEIVEEELEETEPQPAAYELTAQLAYFAEQFGDTVAIFYENLETGFTFSHDGDRVFFAASATKAPYALYIFQKAERGETDLESIHTFTYADFWEGTGVIRHVYSEGAEFSQRRLLYLMVAPSDNIATRILRRAHGLAGYRNFIESIGGNPGFVQNLTYSHLSANESGIMLREMYRYINSGGRYSLQFKQDMLANRYQFITSSYPIASKSGWAGNFGGAWHDIGIIFAPSPYSLALLSTREGNAADRQVYNTISQFIQDFNNYWFVERGWRPPPTPPVQIYINEITDLDIAW